MTESEGTNTDPRRQMLRHMLATLAYRGGKTIANAPEGFAGFRIADRTRTPAEILAHVGDLLDWGHNLARGKDAGRNSGPLLWPEEVARFFAELEKFDSYLASDAALGCATEKLVQGPIADALTHIGQIAMLRRLAGSPVRGENYFKAEILVGHVGAEQSTRRFEFE